MQIRNYIRTICIVVIAVVVLTVALPVLSYVYYAEFLISETCGNSYNMVGAQVTVNNTYLAEHSYINSDGRDTRVLSSGTEIRHMVVNNKTMFATPLNAYESINLTYATGEDPEDYSIILGGSGNLTITDNTTLEILGHDYNIEICGWFETDEDDGAYIFCKDPTNGSGHYLRRGIGVSNLLVYRIHANSIHVTCTNGYHKINLFRDSGNVTVNIDDVYAGSTAYTSNFTDDAYNWKFMGLPTPYVDNITMDIDGTDVLYFSPNDIVSGTTLPDRAGGSNNATITWGTIPACITVGDMGSMIYVSQPLPVESFEEDPTDIIPRGGSQEMDVSPGVPTISGFTEFIAEISTHTGFTQIQLWVMIAIFLTLVATCAVGALVPGHLLIMGVVNMACVVTFWQLGVFPYWVIIISGMVLVGTIISERTPAY